MEGGHGTKRGNSQTRKEDPSYRKLRTAVTGNTVPGAAMRSFILLYVYISISIFALRLPNGNIRLDVGEGAAAAAPPAASLGGGGGGVAVAVVTSPESHASAEATPKSARSAATCTWYASVS